jgi:hypothetical protein
MIHVNDKAMKIKKGHPLHPQSSHKKSKKHFKGSSNQGAACGSNDLIEDDEISDIGEGDEEFEEGDVMSPERGI